MKSKTTAGILALLLGGLGIHKFYLGRILWGFIYLVFCWTFIPAIAALIEGIKYLTMSDDAFNMKYNTTQYMANTIAQGVAAGHARQPINVTVSTNDGRAVTSNGNGWNKVRTTVAGFQHHDGPSIEAMLKPGANLQLIREANNQYDTNAVKVMMGRHFVGYVPKDDAPEVAEAMDRGETVLAKLLSYNPNEQDYNKVRMEISTPA